MNRLGGMIAVMLAAGCTPTDRGPRFRRTDATTRDGGTLRFAVKDQVRTLDPTIGYDEIGYFMLRPLFDTLVDFTPTNLEIIPRLAERWAVSPDGLTYTFELRSGITFSDGVPITAAHFKYGLERALRTEDSPFTGYLGDIEGARDDRDMRGGRHLLQHDAAQAPSAWVSLTESPINVDKTLAEPDAPDDEYVYWPN